MVLAENANARISRYHIDIKPCSITQPTVWYWQRSSFSLSWAQPTYSTLQLIPQINPPYKFGSIQRGNEQLSNGKGYVTNKVLQQESTKHSSDVYVQFKG